MKVSYRSIEEALGVIFGLDSAMMEHPFFGYTPDEYDATDIERGVAVQRCFICHNERSMHSEEDHRRTDLEAEEDEFMDNFCVDEGERSRRLSSHVSLTN